MPPNREEKKGINPPANMIHSNSQEEIGWPLNNWRPICESQGNSLGCLSVFSGPKVKLMENYSIQTRQNYRIHKL